ncbi:MULTISPECIES: helix-turn-helix domain-containing protein [Pannonibacter]|uniref:Helix-turn-helix domain-containing protein n=1 Tax=Pannonibacter tanglangensis TaxID=2750084 RepID=A0ABW9ZM52_9HYPH|nr:MULTISPECIES: helix-turn-helix domain-containing protein [unclassified Pannonibacter]MCY1705855.1 helix-turn-helix domain-containing protein [Pannonibacter sp. SL95]NBN65936.1 helix-turn-helix domain-containing protein [Pannonibacter sp. XCT-34]
MEQRFDPEALLTEREAADFLKISHRALQAWRVRGAGPAFVKVGRLVRYRRAALLDFTASQTFASTTAADAQRLEVRA